MNRRLILGLLGLLALTQCGGPPPPPVLTLTIKGSADQNPDATGHPQPVAVRVYQLSATAKFTQSDIFALKDREVQTLGTESAGSQELFIAPGDSKTIKVDLKPMVSSIGVAVLYQSIDTAQWRATAPANASGPTTLTATVGKLAVTLK